MRNTKTVQLAALLLLLFCNSALAQRITMTVTVTNRAVTSNSFTVNGSSRVFTNVTGALTVATNLSSINATKTNLFNQIASFPFTAVTLVDGNTNGSASTNTFRLIGSFGGALSGSITGISASVSWGFLTLATQSGPNTFPMLWPLANVPQTTNQTNQASDIVNQLNTWPTNFIATNASSFSNYLTKGAHSNQVVTSPVRFTGNLSADKQLLATNGYTVGLTNINPVTSNLVNYGNAIRSEGAGGNSLQLGSNAVALGNFAMAIGNSTIAGSLRSTAIGTAATATNGDSLAIGSSAVAATNFSVAAGSSASANRAYDTALGYLSTVTGPLAIGIGASSTANADSAIGIGYNVQARGASSLAIGVTAFADKTNSMAIGTGATATHLNSAAIGPYDPAGPGVATTTTNQIVLGTAIHSVYVPGVLSVPLYSNITAMAGSTNIARGSWSYPAFALTTLAAGNNISVPFGTNVYIRCGAGPASAATICGIIGGATSGGLDGQIVEVFNDTGFGLTFAVNTVDPIAANRINTPLATDVSIADQASARLMYDGTDARWKLISPFSVTASATNALASIFTNGTVVSSAVTNLNLIYGPGTSIKSTNTSGTVDIEIGVTNRTIPIPFPLHVQSAWRPSTNMPTLEAGYQGWELQFHRTNAAGANVNLYSHWHFTTPTNFVTNSMKLRLWSTLLATNGPNSSNTIWRAQFLRGGATGTNDIRVGAFTASVSATQTWTASYFGTNLAEVAVIDIGTNSLIGPGDFGILKLTRDNVTDTVGNSTALVGAQLEFDTR